MKKMVNGQVVEMTDEEQAEFVSSFQASDEYLRDSALALRNRLLGESDWAVLPDAPTDKKAWKAYRQALRDISLQPNFPHDIVWPMKPGLAS